MLSWLQSVGSQLQAPLQISARDDVLKEQMRQHEVNVTTIGVTLASVTLAGVTMAKCDSLLQRFTPILFKSLNNYFSKTFFISFSAIGK